VKPFYKDQSLVSFPPPGPWAELGACKGSGHAAFFGAGRVTPEVRALCAGCPVQLQCREYALAHPDIRGFWGGLSEVQRKDLRASWRRERRAS
jgi:WhiB family transcriptional regulator, redox-sensing transcriptional regulator